MSGFPQSRYCPLCHTSWPNDHHFTACPACDQPTAYDVATPAEFESVDDALHEATRRRRYTEFEAYCALRDVSTVQEFATMLEHQTPNELAAHFAKLQEQPSDSTTKEVLDGK